MNTFAYPVYASGLSILVLLLQWLVSVVRKRRAKSTDASADSQTTATQPSGLIARFKSHVDQLGGAAIFVWRLSRILAILALKALSVYSLVRLHEQEQNEEDAGSSTHRWLEFGLAVVYVSALP